MGQIALVITDIKRSRHLLSKWRKKARTVKCRHRAIILDTEGNAIALYSKEA